MALSRRLMFLLVLCLGTLPLRVNAHVPVDGEYTVDVTPYEKERRAIPIHGPDKYNAHLNIVPEEDCGWVLANSKIIDQDSNLWYGPDPKLPTRHTYHLCNAFSSQEFVLIEGSLTKGGGGGGGGHTTLPPFWVTVPAVDIDWTGYGTETQGAVTFEKYTAEKYEDGEDTRIVPISTSVEHSLCSRFVIKPPRLKDDTSLVTPMLELTWNCTSLLKIYDANWNQVISGTQFDASSWGAARMFYVIVQPDASTHQAEIVLQGEADVPFEGRGASGRPIDKILGLIPKITVDLDVDSDYDGDIDNDDDALEESPGGLVRVRDALNPGLTPMKLTLTSGASGIVWLRLTSGLGKVRVWENSTMTTLWNSTQPVRLGTLGVPKVFYLEGLVASSLLRDVQFDVDYAKADGTYTCADKIKLTVVKSDLDVDANYDGSISITDDPLEESAGGFTATNVLREIDLAAFPGPNKLTSGGVILSAVAGGDKIKVWADLDKTIEIPLEKTWSVASFPDKLYVEGIKASDTVRDIQLRLCYTNMTFSCRDEIKMTVIAAEIENAAPRDTDDIQIQYFTNNASLFTYTAIPLQVYYTLKPNVGWVPDNVEFRVKNPQNGVIRTVALPLSIGQQNTSWDGKDTGGDYVPYGSNYVIEVSATRFATTCTATNGLTVYEIRQGNCAYHPFASWLGQFHCAIVYGYSGGNSLADINDLNKYTVFENPGVTAGNDTMFSTMSGNVWDYWCPNLTRGMRASILSKAFELEVYTIPYASNWNFLFGNCVVRDDAATSPSGSDWAGTFADIREIRCDGVVESVYESANVRLWGDTAWWNIMTPGDGLGGPYDHHNATRTGLTPARQRNDNDAGKTQNSPDWRYLPY